MKYTHPPPSLLHVIKVKHEAAGDRSFLPSPENKKKEEILRKRNSSRRSSSKERMSSTSRAWVAAASVGVVEALKDQGFCRWNHAIGSLHRHAAAKANLGSLSQAAQGRLPSPAGGRSCSEAQEQQARRAEESLRKVMFLSCWGPN